MRDAVTAAVHDLDLMFETLTPKGLANARCGAAAIARELGADLRRQLDGH